LFSPEKFTRQPEIGKPALPFQLADAWIQERAKAKGFLSNTDQPFISTFFKFALG